MDDDRHQEEELDVKGPGGIGLSFKGNQMFPAILLILLAAVFGYLFFAHDNKQDASTAGIVKSIASLATSIDKSESTQRAMIYVLSLSQEDRQRLNLMKPKELAEMQR